MTPFDRSYTTFLLVGHGKYSCMLYHFQVIWRWIIMTLKSSLKVIQTGSIRKLAYGFLFAFHSNYGRIDNRLWDIQRQTWKLDLEHDLENWVRGCLRLLKTAAFDTSHTTFYWSVIVNIALSCTVFDLTLNDIMTLKSRLEVTQDHSNRYHSKAWVRFPVRLP